MNIINNVSQSSLSTVMPVRAGHVPYVPAQASQHPATKAALSTAHTLPLPGSSAGEVQNLLAGMHDVPHRELEQQFIDTQALLLNSPAVHGQQRRDTLADIHSVTHDILNADASNPTGLKATTLTKLDRRQDTVFGIEAMSLLKSLERYQALGRALIVRNQFIAAANLDTPSSSSQQSGPSVVGGNTLTGDLVQRFIAARTTIETALHQHGLGIEVLFSHGLGALQQGVTLTDQSSGHTTTVYTLSAAQLTEFRDLGRALCDRQINGLSSVSGGGATSTALQPPLQSTASLLGSVPVHNTSLQATSAVTASSSSNASNTLKNILGTDYMRHLAYRFSARANESGQVLGAPELRNAALRTLGIELGANRYRKHGDGPPRIVMSDCLDRIFGQCKLTDKYSVDADVKNMKTLTGTVHYEFVAFNISFTKPNGQNVNETVWMTKHDDNTVSDIRVVPKGSDARATEQLKQLKHDMLFAAIHTESHPSSHPNTQGIPPW
jgi:hypothetical protein